MPCANEINYTMKWMTVCVRGTREWLKPIKTHEVGNLNQLITMEYIQKGFWRFSSKSTCKFIRWVLPNSQETVYQCFINYSKAWMQLERFHIDFHKDFSLKISILISYWFSWYYKDSTMLIWKPGKYRSISFMNTDDKIINEILTKENL